jgi:Glycine-zipper domain
MVRFILALGTALGIVSAISSAADAQYGQYYPPGYRPSAQYYSPPPCQAVTPGPFQGAARGAAGGALFGAIAGNAGRGAAIGAAVGGIAGAARRGAARSSGQCY